jgi:flavorubredoxin
MRETGDFSIDIADIETMPAEELESKLVSSDAILIGSPTINQNTLLPVYRLFSLINPIRDKGKMAGVFGSYGWSGEAPKIISETLRNLKLRVFDETAGFKFAPGNGKKETLTEFGRQFAREFLKYC